MSRSEPGTALRGGDNDGMDLAKKLQIKPGTLVAVLAAPAAAPTWPRTAGCSSPGAPRRPAR
jgi:hypothetical protein